MGSALRGPVPGHGDSLCKQMINSTHPLQFTAVQVEARTSDYVCFECGRQFLTDKQLGEPGRPVTASTSECGLCHAITSTLHRRHFNWLRVLNTSAE